MKTTYYLNKGRNKNLYCRISDGNERVTFSLEYSVDDKNWDQRKSMVKMENEYYYALSEFKRYLNEKYEKLKSEGKDNILERLKNEALSMTEDSGIDGIAEKIFNYYNKEDGLPEYNAFIKAFEKFSNLNKDQYIAETVGSAIHFHTKDLVYEMDTYEGRAANLKHLIESRSYDEICIETDGVIWSDIYSDPGIHKSEFLPEMLKEWEIYWDEKYEEVQEKVGKTNHLDAKKEASWRSFQVFMECYDGAEDGIKLAYNISDFILFPIAVITMLNIFDPSVCYDEYCEFEFFGNQDYKWESISLDDENEDSPVFFVREYEF